MGELWGCYRYFQLLLNNDSSSGIAKLFVEAGVDKTIIEHLLDISEYKLRKHSYNAQMVTDDFMRSNC